MKRVINVMEQLVAQEIERQVQELPPKVQSFLDASDVLGLALNQLPSLYATSEEGVVAQEKQGQNKHGNRIRIVVKQAINATTNQPFRDNKPLRHDAGSEPIYIERIVEVERPVEGSDAVSVDAAALQALHLLIEQQSSQLSQLCEETAYLRSLLTSVVQQSNGSQQPNGSQVIHQSSRQTASHARSATRSQAPVAPQSVRPAVAPQAVPQAAQAAAHVDPIRLPADLSGQDAWNDPRYAY
jgi:hypothetical protein